MLISRISLIFEGTRALVTSSLVLLIAYYHALFYSFLILIFLVVSFLLLYCTVHPIVRMLVNCEQVKL